MNIHHKLHETLGAQLHRFRTDKSGNISVIFSLSITTILLGVGVSLDLNTSYSAHAKMQHALDAAVLAAAMSTQDSAFVQVGEQSYAENLSLDRLTETRVSFERTSEDKIVGIAKGNLPLFMGWVLPESIMDIEVRSVASFKGELSATPCIIALSKTANPGVTLNSGSTLEGSDCEIHVHSESNNVMSANSGIDVDFARVCLAGENYIDNSNGDLQNIETQCDVAANPYEGLVPEPSSVSCDYWNGNYDNPPGLVITLEPGVYCGWHNFNNSNVKVELNPGLYVIRNGGWNVNGGEWEGEGVTFYMYDNSIVNFNSGVNADMSAPTSGDYEGIFMTQRESANLQNYNFNGTSTFIFEGAVYLPRKRVTVNAGSTILTRKMTFVADRLWFNGVLSFETDGSATTGGVVTPYLSE